jgi:hypothetical protein
VIIFELEHIRFEMPSEEQAMKAFQVFKNAKPLSYVPRSEIEGVTFKRDGSHPRVSVSIVPDEQLLENHKEKKWDSGKS